MSNRKNNVNGGTSQTNQTRSSTMAGIVHKISMENFLCHDSLEIEFNQHINFIIGKNGSGKSAVVAALVVALGQKATATSRGSSIKDFIKTGRNRAVVRVTLTNTGLGAYLRDTYGDQITIERVITQTSSSGYKILNENGRVVSNKRADLDRILAKMNLQVDNPVCILNQETAKNFLHSNDPKAKFELFERATQMDQMAIAFAEAEEDLSRSKSCMKEKKSSLEKLKVELKKWHDRNQWYQAIDQVNEKRSKLENMIAWAQIEDYEKQAEGARETFEQQKANLDKLIKHKESIEQSLSDLEDNHRKNNDQVADKVQEIHAARTTKNSLEQEEMKLNKRGREIAMEIRQLEAETKRILRERDIVMKHIDKIRSGNQDSEYAARQEKRLKDLEQLQEREEELNSTRQVTENQVTQLKSAIKQHSTEVDNLRLEKNKIQGELDFKTRTLNELNKAGGNRMTVFGDWVPSLLDHIERANFDEKPRGPAGAFIKVRDKTWVPVVESILSRKLSAFICSSDRDTKLLNRILDELNIRAHLRPTVITSRITGNLYNVGENKVNLTDEQLNRDMHCLMDMIEIEDADVANMFIDMHSIETTLLIARDSDAKYLMSDRYRVPVNCRIAYTKEGNVYYPDPNYKSYAGRINNRARFLQVSVEETIRALEMETEELKQNLQRSSANYQRATGEIQKQETECRAEENRLNSLKRELGNVGEKIRSLTDQKNIEPEPMDILTFEEDLVEHQKKLDMKKAEIDAKKEVHESVKQELQQVKEKQEQGREQFDSLTSSVEPVKDYLKANELKQRDHREKLQVYSSKEETMRKRLREFQSDYEQAKKNAEAEAEVAAKICPRMPVDRSLKALNSELKQILEQLTNHEKEFGSREHVLNEFARRRVDYDRAKTEVNNSNQSLQKMSRMAKKRKDFIFKFRKSIMVRTHYVFQALLRNRNFEGELRFDADAKTLVLMVTPPGRNDVGAEGPPQKRARSIGGTDIRTLSGGERSYATVCFIIALWDAIESPFRVLDEFDVFMDEVNRRVSMDLLITEANENYRHQYIFLTPLGLELNGQPNMSIFKMHDPDRRQTVQES